MKVFVISCVVLINVISISNGEDIPLSECLNCYKYAKTNLNNLLNVIMNVGIIGDCGSLCDYIPGTKQRKSCNSYCQKSGVSTFVNAVTKCDNDNIYFCELIGRCDFIPGGDAKITLVKTSTGTETPGKVDLVVTVQSSKGTGAGEIQVSMETGKVPLAIDFPISSAAKGEQEYRIPVSTSGLQSGKYTLNLLVCSCECDSHHDRSQVYDKHTTTINIG